MTDKQIKEIRQLIYDLHTYYDEKCDYSKGYLDGIFDMCKVFGVNAVRTELSVYMEDMGE